MQILENLKYSRSHEWVRMDGDRAFVGITDFAQHSLGDIVFLELPDEGTEFKKGDLLIPSTKAGYAMKYNEQYLKSLNQSTTSLERYSLANIPVIGVALESYNATSEIAQFIDTKYQALSLQFKDSVDQAVIHKLNAKYKVKVEEGLGSITIELRSDYVTAYLNEAKDILESVSSLSERAEQTLNPEYSGAGPERIFTMIKSGFVSVPGSSNELLLTVTDQQGQIISIANSDSDLQSKLNTLGIKILGLGFLSTEKIQTKSLEVGSQGQPTGITIYDKKTKQPYCLEMEDGQLKTTAGKCGGEDIVPLMEQPSSSSQIQSQSSIFVPGSSSVGDDGSAIVTPVVEPALDSNTISTEPSSASQQPQEPEAQSAETPSPELVPTEQPAEIPIQPIE
jgi:glycine cleavage system H protein